MTSEGREGWGAWRFLTSSLTTFSPVQLHSQLSQKSRTYMITNIKSQWDLKPLKNISKCPMVRSNAAFERFGCTNLNQEVALRTKNPRLSQSLEMELSQMKTSVAAMMMRTTTMNNQ